MSSSCTALLPAFGSSSSKLFTTDIIVLQSSHLRIDTDMTTMHDVSRYIYLDLLR